MFYDRPFIHGRLPKFVLLWTLTMSFWAAYYIRIKNQFMQHNADVTKKILRKTVPFVQAMEDIRFNALSERQYMILKAVTDSEDPEYFEGLRKRYHQEDIFVSYTRGVSNKSGYEGRSYTERFWDFHDYRRPEDETGLVGYQEQSNYS